MMSYSELNLLDDAKGCTMYGYGVCSTRLTEGGLLVLLVCPRNGDGKLTCLSYIKPCMVFKQSPFLVPSSVRVIHHSLIKLLEGSVLGDHSLLRRMLQNQCQALKLSPPEVRSIRSNLDTTCLSLYRYPLLVLPLLIFSSRP